MHGLSFEETLEKKLSFFQGKRLLAAFSGGKDSLAMLDFFNKNQDKYGYSLAACHINHGLRKESGEDERFCRDFCKNEGIAFFSEKLIFSSKEAQGGVEDWARRKRYDALEVIAEKNDFDYILTAHTFDDRIESFFTDLYTGASIFTLGGICFLRGKVCRPMLGISSKDVEDYLEMSGLVPVFDKSNNDVRFIRNKIRLKIMPAFLDAGDDFINTVMRLQEESALLNKSFNNSTQKAVVSNSRELVVIDYEIFKTLSSLEQNYLLGKLFSERFRVTKTIIAESVKLFKRVGSKRIDLPDGFVFEVSMRSIRIFKKCLIDKFYIEKNIKIGRIELLGVEINFLGKCFENCLVIRNRQDGDLFNGKKLKDLFIDKKVDLFQRDRAIIAENTGGKIIWVEGLSGNEEGIFVKRFF